MNGENKVLRYVLRAVKYLLFLCVLYVGLEWAMLTFAPSEAMAGYDIGMVLEARWATERGKMLVVVFVLLAAFYPLFGFMKRRIDGCSFERDGVRIDNAMRLYGFKLKEDRGAVKIYGADSFMRRVTLMFEDKIEVRVVDGGIEMRGLRRSVARIAYQLGVYMHNSRFEDNGNE